MSSKITVYEKPTCTKCRQTNKLLSESGVEFTRINYYEKPLSASKLTHLVKKLGVPAKDLLRKTEKVYRDLKLSRADLSDKEIVELMVKHPDLLQRPIVEKGDKAVLGRPPENVCELFE